MKLREYILVIICFILFGIIFIGKNTLISIIGIAVIYIYLTKVFIHSILRWGKNKKYINSNYSSIKRESIIYEVLILFKIYLDIKIDYGMRAFILEYKYNKIVEISNLKDFIKSYDGIEKVMIYMIIGSAIGIFLSIIKKLICRGRVSPKQILFNNGEIINRKDIKDIKIEESFFEFSKKITINLETNNKVIYMNNKSFSKVEKELVDMKKVILN